MFENKKICATIEARMTSSRLPSKVIKEYCGISNLQHIVERLRRSKYIDEVVVATTVNQTDDEVVKLCEKIGCKYFRGSEEDVLLRVLDAAKSVNADVIVEITGDCPMIDWRHADYLIEELFNKNCDYSANIIERTFPRGFDVQVFGVDVLERVNELTKSPIDHEHVSLYIYTHPEIFKLHNWKANKEMNHPEIEVTLDMLDDYLLINEIYKTLYPNNPDFSGEDVVKLILSNPELYQKSMKQHRKDPFKEQKEWEEKNGTKL